MLQNNQLIPLAFILSGEYANDHNASFIHALSPHRVPREAQEGSNLTRPSVSQLGHLSPMFNPEPSCFNLSLFPIWSLQTCIVIAGDLSNKIFQAFSSFPQC